MFRLFVAIGLPDLVKDQLMPMCGGLPGARWIEPGNMHLSIRFIGEVDGGVFADVREALADVKAPVFFLSLKGTGFFPPKQHPKTLWAGIDKSEELTVLHNRVESALARTGLPREGRKFAPHIALARLNDSPIQRVANWLSANALFRSDRFPVSTFGLYTSTLTNHGAEYQLEQEYSLNGDGNPKA